MAPRRCPFGLATHTAGQNGPRRRWLPPEPLAKPDGPDGALGSKQKFALRKFLGKDATRGNLARILRGEIEGGIPALIISGTHGMEFELGDARQSEAQGALVCQDWPGYGSIEADDWFALAMSRTARGSWQRDRIGHAADQFNIRWAALSADLTESLQAGNNVPNAVWVGRDDARNPAIRLRVNDMPVLGG